MLPNTTPAPKPEKVVKEKAPKPVKVEKPKFTFGQDTDEQTILSDIRTLSSSLEANNLEIGWKCAEYYGLVKQDGIDAFGSERKALSETISFLAEDCGQKRGYVADRMRVCMVITRDTYDAIVAECKATQAPEWRGPNWFQLRSCVVTENGSASQAETNDRLNWSVANNWPSARDIANNFAPAGQPKLTPADRAWNIMVKQAQTLALNTGPENPRNKIAQEIMKLWAADSTTPKK
jgi:hypothetical protein